MLNKGYMENDQKFQISAKAVNALAIIGFVALVGGGISLAVFGARFVPTAVSGLSSAAVSLSSIFVPNDEATTTPSGEENATSTPSEIAETTTTPEVATTTTPVATKPVTPRAGQETVDIGQLSTTGTPVLSGLPDLVTTITESGYFATTTLTELSATTTIPTSAAHIVIRFKIQNKGANVVPAGWAFTAILPAGMRTYPNQQALLPGERIEYQLYFDRPVGATQTVSVSADVNGFVGESKEDNNIASTTFKIL
jgi:hypothetical protein